MKSYNPPAKFASMTQMIGTEPQEPVWGKLFSGFLSFKISSSVALALVLFFATSVGAITMVAQTEMSNAGLAYEQDYKKPANGRVLGVASYGYNQPVCGRNTSNCLNHMLSSFSGNGWQVRIDYQLEPRVVGVIKVNGWNFANNITGSGSQYTGYDLEPGEDYNFILYKKVGRKLVKVTNLKLTAPEEPNSGREVCPEMAMREGCYLDYSHNVCGDILCPVPPICPSLAYPQCKTGETIIWSNDKTCPIPKCSSTPACTSDAFQCSDGSYVSRSGPYCEFKCPTTPSYGYYGHLQVSNANNSRPVTNPVPPGSSQVNLMHFNLSSVVGSGISASYQHTFAKIALKADSANTVSNLASAYLTDGSTVIAGSTAIAKRNNSYNSSDNEIVFVFDSPLVLPAGITKTLTLKADLAKNASGSMSFSPYWFELTHGSPNFSNAEGLNSWWSSAVQILATPPICPHLAFRECTQGETLIWEGDKTCPIPRCAPNDTIRIGKLVNVKGTVFLVGEKGLYGIPSLEVFNSWGWSFQQVVEANAQESALSSAGTVPFKSQYCSSALDQINGNCPVQPVIKVLSPNGGEVLVKGSTYTIKWDAKPNVDYVVIALYTTKTSSNTSLNTDYGCMSKTDGTYNLCGTNVNMRVNEYDSIRVPNTGSYEWKVSTQIPDGKDYYIAVGTHEIGNPSPGMHWISVDSSDRPFSISAPTPVPVSISNMRVSDSVLVKGQTYRFKWDSSGMDIIYIWLYKKSSGNQVAYWISDLTKNNGYFDWTVPAKIDDGNDYYARVTGKASGDLGSSDTVVFAIKSGIVSCPVVPEPMCRQNQTVIWREENGCRIPSGCVDIPTNNTATPTSTPVSVAPTNPSYRQIKIETPASNSWIAWREIEIYGADGKKIVPVSSSVNSEYRESTAGKAYDGNVSTVWNSGGQYNGSITLDLGADKQVSKIRLLPANFPSPATTTHFVRGKTAGGASFNEITRFGGLVKDNEWLEYVVK